jgi:Mg-chelatase subunit ChlD
VPTATLNPDRVEPAAAQTIVESWGTVKKPGVVTLVVDTPGSMAGKKLEQAGDGVLRMLDNVDGANRVGLLTFADGLREYVPVAPVSENRFAVVEVAKRMRASGATELYTALQSAVKMTDEAEADLDATRGVVVLTDGRATGGPAAPDGGHAALREPAAQSRDAAAAGASSVVRPGQLGSDPRRGGVPADGRDCVLVSTQSVGAGAASVAAYPT